MLPKRQQECFDFIRDFRAENGYSPTVREIADHMGISSPNGVVCNLKPLQKKGVIDWSPEKARSITIVGESDGWIRTAEQLPDNGSRVLVFCPTNPRAQIFLDLFDGEWFDEVSGYRTEPPTHWMPLPKPPKETPCQKI